MKALDSFYANFLYLQSLCYINTVVIKNIEAEVLIFLDLYNTV